jgi:hypothetical protein
LDGAGFFRWVGWGRLFQMSWMGTAFFNGLNRAGFFRWVGWKRLFQMGWMGRLFQMGWLRTAFSYELTEDSFFKLYTLSHQLLLLTHLRSEVVNRLVM